MTIDIGYSLFINAPTAFPMTLILFMAMNELLSMSNHLKTIKILMRYQPHPSVLEPITKDSIKKIKSFFSPKRRI
ncbi:hypothetical protein [Vibrio alginolyticus]|uniref:hypothetical protein n=1 Tax=Vibrio alginolyticus TaxID=663 RepID=UPI000ADF01DB